MILEISWGGRWFCTLPEDEWSDDADVRAKIRADFSPEEKVGDRRQELVFMGIDLNWDRIW